jgi:hypothetical protein
VAVGLLMRCMVEFLTVEGEGHRELIDSVRLDVRAPSDAKTLASAMMKHTTIRGRTADIAVIKSMLGRIMDVIDREVPDREPPDNSTIFVW